ncbi:hypothetical protein AAGG74_17235 [Bacillus mexicanus]|uniref:hypothetical protein n=1 Tax=Bacillus mexicanus TaxID=2834415 RepID=UPI003D1F7742
MQVFSSIYLKNHMKNCNKRVDSLYCLANIPHETHDDLSFENNLDYEVLGIHWSNESFVVMNDFGEVTEVSIYDRRFKVYQYTENYIYPANFLMGVGMNKKNHWNWFN